MKLEKLLNIINESTVVNIVDYDTNQTISFYDGKNSIDSALNEKKVVSQRVANDQLYIDIIM